MYGTLPRPPQWWDPEEQHEALRAKEKASAPFPFAKFTKCEWGGDLGLLLSQADSEQPT
jgi:hypothetical protein